MARRRRGRPAHPDLLTPREWRVLDFARHGLGRTAIADRLGISVYGARWHLRNIAGKLGVDRTAELRHWPGFPAESPLQARRPHDMTTTGAMNLGPLGQVSILTRSAEAFEAWYRDVLGLAHLFTFGDLVFFDCGGTRLYARQVPDDQWRPSSILYFIVDDIAAAHGELSRRGVRFGGAPHMIHRHADSGVEEWMAFFEDPDGNTLALMARTGARTATA